MTSEGQSQSQVAPASGANHANSPAPTKHPSPPSIAARFGGLISGTAILAVIYLYDRTGIFTAMRGKGPLSVDQIASLSNTRTRLLNESLPSLAGAGFLDYRGEGKYELTEEQAAVLCDPQPGFWARAESNGTTTPTSLVGWTSMMHGVYSILPSLADSMKSTGPPGVPFTAYGASFPHGLARMRAVTLQETVPKQILPQMGLAELLESGEGLQVADVGCGLGLFSLALAARYPKTKVYGFDVDANSIELAKKNLEQAKEEGTVPREVSVEFQVRSLYKLDEFVTSDGGKPFDLVFAFDMIHDLDNPLLGVTAIRRSLKQPGGMLVLMEPKVPEKFEDRLTPEVSVLYAISTLHCVPQSLAGGGPGLGAAWGKSTCEKLIKEAGFREFEERAVNVPGFLQGMYVATA